jgi:hypothetical protein
MGVALAAAIGAASVDAQTTVVIDHGTAQGQLGVGVPSGTKITSRFTLAEDTTISGFTFGGWTWYDYSITSVDWGFDSAADGRNYDDDGTASLSHGDTLFTLGGQSTVKEYTAWITPQVLAAGTYFFTLQNFQTDFGPAYVDASNAGLTYTDFEMINNSVENWMSPPHYQLLSGSPAPEPASWAMMLGGFGLIGGMLRSRRKSTVSFA